MSTTAVVVAGMRCAGEIPPPLAGLLTAATHAGAEVVLVLGDRSPQSKPPVPERVRVGYIERGRSRHAFFRAGLELLCQAATLSQLVLCDDSFVAVNPAQLLSQATAASAGLDLASLTVIEAPEPCLQSYWLSFAARALGSAAFNDWWRRESDDSDSSLTRRFLAAGCRAGGLLRLERREQIVALCRAHACGALHSKLESADEFLLDPAAARSLDPTMFAWDSLLASFGVVSLALLEENPHRVNIARLRRWIAETPGVAALFA